MAKLKQYNLTTLIRGVEVLIICATNSKKNFAQLIDKPYGYVRDYAGQGSEIETCVANPHKLDMGISNDYLRTRFVTPDVFREMRLKEIGIE